MTHIPNDVPLRHTHSLSREAFVEQFMKSQSREVREMCLVVQHPADAGQLEELARRLQAVRSPVGPQAGGITVIMFESEEELVAVGATIIGQSPNIVFLDVWKWDGTRLTQIK